MEYFAAANTKNGFKSLFDECLKNTERVYILKGSSGCGKSTLMKRVAGKAQKMGLPFDLIYCSSDPDSLDGVILPTVGKAVIDGTAPHVMDVKYPCVRETIINLGQFWDESKLLPRRKEIIDLTDRKGLHYKNAYRCLSALGEVEEMKRELLSRAVQREKLDSIVLRLAEKITSESGNAKTLFATAFTSSGIKTLPVFGEVKTLYRVNGNLSEIFMLAFERAAAELGKTFVCSRSAIDPSIPDALYFESSGVLVSGLSAMPCKSVAEEKNISTSRFTDNGALASSRMKLRALEKLSNELAVEAKNELLNAKTVHNDIEDIYIPSMDFKSLDDYTVSLINSIFSE